MIYQPQHLPTLTFTNFYQPFMDDSWWFSLIYLLNMIKHGDFPMAIFFFGPASQVLWVASMPGRHSRVDLKKLHLGVNSARENRKKYRLS